MTTIAIDGLSEENFRRAIENRLREGAIDAALERIRRLLQPYACKGGILPERFLTVTSDDLVLMGWERLGQAIESHDREGRPITAISVNFGWPGEDAPGPDESGNLRPHIETSYYSDDAFPFSKSTRADLLEGYSYHGCTWAADCEATDFALSLDGIDDLHGALAKLEARLLESDEPDEDEVRAGSLGACLLSVLLHEAVRNHTVQLGLPRHLSVTSGSNDVYPYFDAPVVGVPEEVCKAAEALEEAEPEYNLAVPAQRYSSLLMANIPRARKRMALVLDESIEETTTRIAKLRGMGVDERHVPDEHVLESVLAPPPEPQVITPVPGGPLMVKKMHGIPTDFRDMLGPREPLAPPPEPPPPLAPVLAPGPLPQPPAPKPVAWDPRGVEPARAGSGHAEPIRAVSVHEPATPVPEPVLREPQLQRPLVPLAAAPSVPAEPAAGSALPEQNLQERLRTLIAAQLAPEPQRGDCAVPSGDDSVGRTIAEGAQEPVSAPAEPSGMARPFDPSEPEFAAHAKAGVLASVSSWIGRRASQFRNIFRS